MDSFDKRKKQGSGGSRPSDKRGGGGAGHPDTEIRGGGARSQKKIFRPSKNKGGARAPRAPPLDPLLRGTNKRELAHSLLVPI